MNKVKFIIKLTEQIYIVCPNYLKNMKNTEVAWDKITHVVPYMAVVK